MQTNNTSGLLPAIDCRVRQNTNGKERFGHVLQTFVESESIRIKVRWTCTRDTTIEDLNDLHCGFKPMVEVQDVPKSRVRKPLGEGTVLKTRNLGNREQVLVDFPNTGQQLWLPYENLKQIKGAKHRFVLGDQGPADSAERFRLKALAHALQMWNENTGSLSHLDIDPLPHQIHLVHHILASGDLNWLIADDVGLGKTIETGMLLAALKQRGNLNRTLLVTPAGLTKQWQEELNTKFGMSEFQIYGEDFHINESRHWKMYDHVIASMDRLKDEKHLESIQQAGSWDLIVFDEAHRLSRRQYGMKLDSSKRFQLAATLRNNTDSLLMLTATPHQGMQDKFQALLELLHPERKDEISTLPLNPEIIGDMIFRNNKADVTDAEGNFIFKGKTTKALRVKVSDSALEFDAKLQKYLRQGYAAGNALGIKGNAIGFVMTVYRKLAASSVAAIHNALKNRYARLQGESTEALTTSQIENQDQRYAGEWEEQVQTETREFFAGELDLLANLIKEAESLRNEDKKLQLFLDEVIEKIRASNQSEKVLIFTEYRTTQTYLKSALEERYGQGCVELINGSMAHQNRRDAITNFEGETQFLISTEAGGEGINLQRNCHTMVNYDLPWNPMRLVQRIGRLYRYGQQNRVVVLNIHSPDTADEQIMDMMYSRINQVVSDLAGVSNEFNDHLQDEILGEVADLIDVGTILQEATSAGITRTIQRIDEAMERAKEASAMQMELFEHAATFKPNETSGNLQITTDHGAAFVTGMFNILDIQISETTHGGRIWQIRLPEDLQAELGVTRSRYDVTLDSSLGTSRNNTHVLDLDSFIMKYLITQAKSYQFMGITGVLQDTNQAGAYITNILRWQNDQGARRRQEFTVYGLSNTGQVSINPDHFSDWLKQPAATGKVAIDREQNKAWFASVEKAAHQRLNEVSNQKLHPQNYQWVSGAWTDS